MQQQRTQCAPARAVKRARFTVHSGKSKHDGAPVVALLKTSKSKNRKTGNVATLTYLRADVNPGAAVRDGLDASVCGACPFRPVERRKLEHAREVALGRRLRKDERSTGCYVPIRALQAQWKAFRRGAYPAPQRGELARALAGRVLRFGIYGNGSQSIPFRTAARLAKLARGHMGYDHNWREVYAQPWRALTMASVGSLAEKREANALGWRTFRVTRDLSDRQADEVVCPATTKGLTCEQCRYCDGNGVSGEHATRKSVVILDHGPTSARTLDRLAAMQEQQRAGRVALPMA
jgi:hypothetical protein